MNKYNKPSDPYDSPIQDKKPKQLLKEPLEYTKEPNRHYQINEKHKNHTASSKINYNFKLEPGYQIEVIASGLKSPTSITFDEDGTIYIGESGYSYGPAQVGGGIKKIDAEGNITDIASNFDSPLTGVTWHKGNFFVATGNNPGKIYRLDKDGNREMLIDGLSTGGAHYTSNIVFDQNDHMYFSTGNGLIYQANLDGSNIKQYASGLRKPSALNVSPCGILYSVDQGYDVRGSRPVANAPDTMYQILPGGWYGWPDYIAGIPITDERFRPDNEPSLEFVLTEHPLVSGYIITNFDPNSAAMKFDFSNNPNFGYFGDAFVSLFGSLSPMTDNVDNYPGHKVVRVDMKTGEYYPFLTNGPESSDFRPIDVKFTPNGDALYVLDYGRIDVDQSGVIPYTNSGTLYKISKIYN